MNDDVLLEIFEYLDFRDHYTLAKCSKRFRALAQRSFKTVLKGRLERQDTVDEALEVLQIFGKQTKHYAWQATPANPFPYLSVDQLKSMELHGLQIHLLNDGLRESSLRFVALTHLKVHMYYNSMRMVRMNFRGCFPNLKSLSLLGAEFICAEAGCQPTTLTHLSYLVSAPSGVFWRDLLQSNPNLVDVRINLDEFDAQNAPIHYMVELGLHKTITHLDTTCEASNEQYAGELAESLQKFKQLQRLRLQFESTRTMTPLVTAFCHLKSLQALNFYVQLGGERKLLEFLWLFAASAPTNLKTLHLERDITSPTDNQIWREFIKEMPKTCECYAHFIPSIWDDEEEEIDFLNHSDRMLQIELNLLYDEE